MIEQMRCAADVVCVAQLLSVTHKLETTISDKALKISYHIPYDT